MKITREESLITGGWILKDGRVVADENCHRINSLVHDYLKELIRDDSGWRALCLDSGDSRLWELTYPEAESHGGGPPQLRCLSAEEAKNQYPGLNDCSMV